MSQQYDNSIRSAERNAILSSACGVSGEVILTDSAVILLYAQALGAGDTLALLSTAVLPLLNGLLIIPLASLASHCAKRNFVIKANSAALLGYLCVSAAACFSGSAATVLIGGLLFFSICQTAFVAGWFPLLETFLDPKKRTSFLGKMRFCHQLAAISCLGLISLIAGNKHDLSSLQMALFIGAIVFSGRIFFIWRMPEFSVSGKETVHWLESLKGAVKDKTLSGFAIYSFLFNLSAFGTLPLILLYLKQSWMISDRLLIIVSALAFSGMLGGYAMAHCMKEIMGGRKSLIMIHSSSLLLQILIFLSPSGGIVSLCMITALLAACNFCIAANSVIGNAEMMKQAAPEIKTVALAFSGAFYYGGAGLGRLLSSCLLGLILSAQDIAWITCINPYKMILVFFIATGFIGVVQLHRLCLKKYLD